MQHADAKKIAQYVVPTMLSNVCFFLFSVVDGIFIGQGVRVNGLGSVNLVLPFVLVTGAIFQMICIGGATIFAVDFGKGEKEHALHVFRNSTVMLLIAAVVLSLVGTIFTRPVCRFFGAGSTYLEMSADYLFWYAAFVVPSGLSMALQAFCRNDDDPFIVAVVVVATTVMNIFGDWYLIFPMHMGTKGAAIATGVSQTAGLFICLTHFMRKKGILRFGRVHIDIKTWGDIAVHGLPEGIGQLSTPVMTLCMNIVLVRHVGDIGVNAFSIISYVASFTVAVFFGTSEGLQPLLGRTYGMKSERDIRYIFHAGLWINFIGALVLNGLILVFSPNICGLFGADTETLQYTLVAMPKYSWGFIVMAFNVMISSYLYSTERSKYAIVLNLLRSVVVDVIVILLLPAVFGAGVVWFTFGIYEAVILVIAIALLRHSERNGIVFR